jgi:hypothetical protein
MFHFKCSNHTAITVDNFIQSIGTCQTGDAGFCKLASVSNGNDGAIYNFGFRFKVIRSRGSIVLSVKLDSFASDEPKQTVVIATEKQLTAFIENMRQWAVDELSYLLYRNKSLV